MTQAIRFNSDNLVSLTLINELDNTPVTGATVTGYLYAGGSNSPLDTFTLDDQGNGLYQGTLTAENANLADCSTYIVKVIATKDDAQWEFLDNARLVGDIESACRLIDWNSDYLARGNYQESDAVRITSRIEAATTAIQRYCNRNFIATTYDEFARILQTNQVAVRNFPLQWVRRVCDTIQGAFTLQNTSGSVTNATYNTDSSGITLTHVIAGIATSTTITYATLEETELLSAINGLGNGWTATNSATSPTVAASDIVSGQFGNAKQPATVTMWLDCQPPVRINEQTGILSFTGNTPNAAFLASDSWPSLLGFNNTGGRVRVVYRAGYDPWDIPSDLQSACAEIVMLMDQGYQVLASETLGGYSYSLASAMDALQRLPTTTRRTLEGYKTRKWAGF